MIENICDTVVMSLFFGKSNTKKEGKIEIETESGPVSMIPSQAVRYCMSDTNQYLVDYND